ncbi:hypothetical protein JCM6882_000119 [Rhodosporidiobolus microsporus]
MDSSPSSHQFKSLNQEDKAASRAREGVEGAGQASSPTSLLDLPDELLASIFDQVHHSLRPEEDSQAEGLLVPLEHILINKRIFAIVRPLWFQSLASPWRRPRVDAFLASILAERETCWFTKSLYIDYAYAFPDLQMSAVRCLHQLTSLTICCPGAVDDDDDDTFPVRVTDGLKSLRNLRHLRIIGPADIEDKELSLERDLPSLRSLDIDNIDLMRQLLSPGGSRITTLFLRSIRIAGCSLPWHALETIRICEEAEYDDDPEAFLSSLENAVETEIPLRQLAIEFRCSATLPDGNLNRFNITHLRKLLDILPATQLEALDLRLDEMLGEWTPGEFQITSVYHLVLRASTRLSAANNLATLCAFISFFPCAISLHLHDFYFSGTDGQADALSALSPADTALQYPHLVAFLAVMRDTSILSIRYRGSEEKREMRWTRGTVEEEFVGEGWTVE